MQIGVDGSSAATWGRAWLRSVSFHSLSRFRHPSHGRGIGNSGKHHSRVVRKTGMARDGGARQAAPLPGAVRENFEILAQPVAQGEPGNVAR